MTDVNGREYCEETWANEDVMARGGVRHYYPSDAGRRIAAGDMVAIAIRLWGGRLTLEWRAENSHAWWDVTAGLWDDKRSGVLTGPLVADAEHVDAVLHFSPGGTPGWLRCCLVSGHGKAATLYAAVKVESPTKGGDVAGPVGNIAINPPEGGVTSAQVKEAVCALNAETHLVTDLYRHVHVQPAPAPTQKRGDCGTCRHKAVPPGSRPCKRCVRSGTFALWESPFEKPADPFAPGTFVTLVGKGDADSIEDDTRWEHIGERGIIARADIAARVNLPADWRLVALDSGGFVAWPTSGMAPSGGGLNDEDAAPMNRDWEETMSEQTWAEGSGSTWKSLDGDLRIVASAEVLVGKHRTVDGDDNWTEEMAEYVGRRLVVEEHSSVDHSGCRVRFLEGAGYWGWRVRDHVCLRTADGTLTDEGRWLAEHASYCDGDATAECAWAVRAGILMKNAHGICVVNRHRLDMALGREPAVVIEGVQQIKVTGTVVDRRCHTCGDAQTSIDRYPCNACEHYYLWSPARRAEAPTQITATAVRTPAEAEPVKVGDVAGPRPSLAGKAPSFKTCGNCASTDVLPAHEPCKSCREHPSGHGTGVPWERPNWSMAVTGSKQIKATVTPRQCDTCVRAMATSREAEPCKTCWSAPQKLPHWAPHVPGAVTPETGPAYSPSLAPAMCAGCGRVFATGEDCPYCRPARRCSTCGDAQTSAKQYPCRDCLNYSMWSTARRAEAPTQITAKAVRTPAELARVCVGCGRPLDPSRDRFDLYGRCADCGFLDEREGEEAGRAALAPEPVDRSGEAHLASLRDWLDGPCGRQAWAAPPRRRGR